MSQHDMTIDTTFGQDIQDALQALASTAKGNSAPSALCGAALAGRYRDAVGSENV